MGSQLPSHGRCFTEGNLTIQDMVARTNPESVRCFVLSPDRFFHIVTCLHGYNENLDYGFLLKYLVSFLKCIHYIFCTFRIKPWKTWRLVQSSRLKYHQSTHQMTVCVSNQMTVCISTSIFIRTRHCGGYGWAMALNTNLHWCVTPIVTLRGLWPKLWIYLI